MQQSIKVFGNLFIKEIIHGLVYGIHGLVYGCTREENKENAQWKDFVDAMSAYYKPTESITLKHFQFWSNIQKDGETFITCCNHALLEAKHCNFKCTAEDTAVRDQIIIKLKCNDILQEALKKSWDLDTLQRESH